MEKNDIEEINKILIEKRRKVLKAIRDGPKTTQNLEAALGTRSWHLTRYHLRKLEKHNFIIGEKIKKTTIFTITGKGYAGLKYFGE